MTRRVLVAVLGIAMLVTGCNAPTRQYVAADRYGMYFALPAAWTSVPTLQLQKAETGWTDDAGKVITQTLQWQGAWSDGDANANAVFAAAAPKKPVVWAFVRDLISAEQQAISGSATALADVVIPATAIADAGGEVRTEQLRSGGFRGIHQFATYRAGGRMQTVEAVTMLAPGKNRVYGVVARCTEQCFADNSGTINAIFDSLTFKEPRG